MKKLLIAALALITVLTMSLTACGNNTQNPDTNNDLTDDWVDDDNGGNTSGDNTNGEQNGGSSETPADTQAWVDMNDTVYVLGDGVNLRTSPNSNITTNFKVQLTMKTQLQRTKAQNSADGWSEVTYNGETAYIKSVFLTTNANDADFVAEETPSKITLDSDVYSVNLRTAPTAKTSETLKNGKSVVAATFNAKNIMVIAKNKTGTWAKIDYDGSTLYIACSTFDGVLDNAPGGLG